MRTNSATEISGEPLSRASTSSASAGFTARSWIAAGLSIVAPGVGHLYAGRPKRGSGAWLLTRIGGLLAAGAVVVLSGRPALAAYVAVWVGVVLAAAVDAVGVVRSERGGDTAVPRWFQRPAALVVACGIVWAASIAWSVVVADTIAKHTRVRTDSMAPTILRGERLFIAPRRGGRVHRGDLVAYRLWDTPFVKRIVGVPGDTLAMRAGIFSIDGHAMAEPYAQHVGEGEISDPRFDWQRAFVLGSDRGTYTPTLATWGPLVVPPANYFLLGDNRGETSDSRYNGFVPDSTVFGRPLTVYFSRDPVRGRVRWDRIGARLEATPLIVPAGDRQP